MNAAAAASCASDENVNSSPKHISHKTAAVVWEGSSFAVRVRAHTPLCILMYMSEASILLICPRLRALVHNAHRYDDEEHTQTHDEYAVGGVEGF